MIIQAKKINLSKIKATPVHEIVEEKVIKEVPIEEEPKRRNLWEELDTEEDI